MSVSNAMAISLVPMFLRSLQALLNEKAKEPGPPFCHCLRRLERCRLGRSCVQNLRHLGPPQRHSSLFHSRALWSGVRHSQVRELALRLPPGVRTRFVLLYDLSVVDFLGNGNESGPGLCLAGSVCWYDIHDIHYQGLPQRWL